MSQRDTAPFVVNGPMTGEAFRAYVEHVLAPELEPGDAVVMDNVSTHKVAGVDRVSAPVTSPKVPSHRIADLHAFALAMQPSGDASPNP